MELGNEDDLTLWIMRLLLRGGEIESASSRHEIEAELHKRMEQQDATNIALGPDMVLARHVKSSYAYTPNGVNRLREFLVDGGLISEEEWNREVSWTPKVSRHGINKWLKLGDAVKALVDQATMGSTGVEHTLDGPKLEDIQKKRPDAVAEAAGKLP